MEKKICDEMTCFLITVTAVLFDIWKDRHLWRPPPPPSPPPDVSSLVLIRNVSKNLAADQAAHAAASEREMEVGE